MPSVWISAGTRTGGGSCAKARYMSISCRHLACQNSPPSRSSLTTTGRPARSPADSSVLPLRRRTVTSPRPSRAVTAATSEARLSGGVGGNRISLHSVTDAVDEPILGLGTSPGVGQYAQAVLEVQVGEGPARSQQAERGPVHAPPVAPEPGGLGPCHRPEPPQP